MHQKNIFLTVALFFIIPFGAHAQVLFSEIAWMGTDDDANNEWIEIYNFSTSPTDLTGWTLTSDDGALSIPLAGTLSPHGVAVLERTDESTLPGVTALLTYTGGLSNEGRTLVIKDAAGNTSDEAVGGTDWSNIGGSNVVPKKTAQRTRSGSWVTAAPTPGAQNAEVSDVTNNDTTTKTTATNSNQTTENTQKRSGGGGSSAKKQAAEAQQTVLTLDVEAPTIAYVNQPIRFTAEPSGAGPTIMSSLTYRWNLGDLQTGNGKMVTHSFAYPGEYIVFVEGSFAKQHAEARHEIKVLPNSISLSRTAQNDLVMKNTASYEIDISGFVLEGVDNITFPEHSFLKGGGSITIPEKTVGRGIVKVHDRRKVLIASHGISEVSPLSKVTPQRIAYQVVVPTEASTHEVATPTETVSDEVVTIGKTEPEQKSEGFIAKIMRRIGALFGS